LNIENVTIPKLPKEHDLTRQKDIFLTEEGNNYFNRNRNGETAISNAREYAFLTRFIKENSAVLEVGCGDGKNVKLLTKPKGVSYSGIDPSSEAIKKAAQDYPHMSFKQGTSDELPFKDSSFDFIYLGFFLYVVDRNLLTKIVQEVDRCLKDNGVLAITDFSPAYPYNTTYRHHAELLTYKYDYSQMFTGFPHFHLLESRLHEEHRDIADDKFWVSTKVLLKSFLLTTHNLLREIK
jgi:ubiquinone/menaquinone biosynthesis C-methylase UbiE